MEIVDIYERAVPISRFSDPLLPSGGLTTSLVVLVTDVIRNGLPVVGYGFSSFGRYGQSGLIRERFIPRLRAANKADLTVPDGTNFDPFRCWSVMMAGEKKGGHGDRSVALGTLDMAIWDAAAKIANLPLYRFIAESMGVDLAEVVTVPVYAAGGYPYPTNDIQQLVDEVRGFLDGGFTRVKIKVGTEPLDRDLRRIEAVLALLPSAKCLAVDAMNVFDSTRCMTALSKFAPYGLWWCEDICDPLDFDTLEAAAKTYTPPIAAGEALFSVEEARLLERYGGLRPGKDVLVFDPVHCYGLSHYLKIVRETEVHGWPRRAFWPHGGHQFSIHVAAGLGLGGSEVNPSCFQPLAGLADDQAVENGGTRPLDLPGIGIEALPGAHGLFSSLAVMS